jgi:2,4-dienoyl-CoA reductase-like NADH-dependent reductase (Old Yellow Enzyme family)/thioredoxin reductase
MSLIKSIMGRRQFLVAAGVTSTSALAYNKLAGIMDPVFQTNTAMASEKAGTTGMRAAYLDSSRYSHLLSPLKIGNVVLKNRMYFTNAVPHYIQGPENFPAETSRTYAANLAKNGAATITCRIIQRETPRKELQGDSAHMLIYDLEDYGVQNYLDQLVEGIHCYDSKASVPIFVSPPGTAPGTPPGRDTAKKDISVETLQKLIEDTVKQTKFFQSHGFDMVTLGDMLASNMKIRTDQYGGNLKNRARFSVELYQAIKKGCGQDFLIEAFITIIEPSIRQEETSAAYTLDEAIELMKLWEGLVDILQIRVAGGKANHPTGWNSEKNKPLTLRFAQAIKQSGAKIAIAPNGGFQDLDFIEECIATGKADMIGMGHAFICDWEYGEKAHQGRGEDVVPCIRCNKCHGLSQKDKWYTVCSVNPKLGIDSAVRLIDAPVVSKKVAVIGGGPAGMKAAITAAERGHKVTLYEKGSSLGGKLTHTDFSPYKWPLKDFKDYLIRQVNRVGIEVYLGAEATPEMIKSKGYDTVLVAIGAEPNVPRIPGVDGKNVWNIVNVYEKEKELGKMVTLIGGGEFGTETAIYLAKAGHNVTVLTSEKELVKNDRVHYPDQIIDTYEHMDNFSSITEATASRISEGKVTYVDAKGDEKSIKADSVVVYAGLNAKKDEALKFYGSANRFLTVGDCSEEGGDVQRSIRSAFFAASRI